MHYKLCMCGFSQHRRHTRATPGRCWCGLGQRRGRAVCGQTRLWRLQHVTRALCGWAPPWAPRPHCHRQQVTWPQMFLQSSPWFHCPQTTASSSLRTTPGWLSPALSWVPSPRHRLRPRCAAGTPPHLDFLLLVTSSPTTVPPSFASNKVTGGDINHEILEYGSIILNWLVGKDRELLNSCDFLLDVNSYWLQLKCVDLWLQPKYVNLSL